MPGPESSTSSRARPPSRDKRTSTPSVDGCVPQGVVHEIRHDTTKTERVAHDHHRFLDVQRNRSRRVRRRRVLRDVVDELCQIDGGSFKRLGLRRVAPAAAALLPAFPSGCWPVRFGEWLHRALRRPATGLRATAPGDAEDHRHRRTKFVRGVRHKLAKSRLERELLVEHEVERIRELSRLGATLRVLHSTRSVARGDGIGHFRYFCNCPET